jgi:hypothetical protein
MVPRRLNLRAADRSIDFRLGSALAARPPRLRRSIRMSTRSPGMVAVNPQDYIQAISNHRPPRIGNPHGSALTPASTPDTPTRCPS